MIDYTNKKIVKYCGMIGHAISFTLKQIGLDDLEAVRQLEAIAIENNYTIMKDYMK